MEKWRRFATWCFASPHPPFQTFPVFPFLQVIADLEQEVSRVATAHARLVRAAERKLRDFGIPTEELGFLPVVASAPGSGRGARRPAGVVEGVPGAGGKSVARDRVLDVMVNRSTIKA